MNKKNIKVGINFNLLNELVEWHSEITSPQESQKYIMALNQVYDRLINEDILLKLLHNVNWEIEKVVVSIEQEILSGTDVISFLRNIQRQHLNYADQDDLTLSLQEYEEEAK